MLLARDSIISITYNTRALQLRGTWKIPLKAIFQQIRAQNLEECHNLFSFNGKIIKITAVVMCSSQNKSLKKARSIIFGGQFFKLFIRILIAHYYTAVEIIS